LKFPEKEQKANLKVKMNEKGAILAQLKTLNKRSKAQLKTRTIFKRKNP